MVGYIYDYATWRLGGDGAIIHSLTSIQLRGKSGLWRGMYRCLGGPMGTPMAPGGTYRAPVTCLGLLGLRNNLYANSRKVLLDSISVERG